MTQSTNNTICKGKTITVDSIQQPLGRPMTQAEAAAKTAYNRVVTDRVREAIANTKKIQSPEGYWDRMLESRAEETAAGSYFDLSAKEVEGLIEGAVWEEYSHPSIQGGCTGFCSLLIGYENIVPIESLEPSTEGVLMDPKGTGTMEFQIQGETGRFTDITVLILGQHEGMEVVYTFHPGAPVRPSTVPTEPDKLGKPITAKEALDIGLTNAKIVIAR